jgi:HEAT repeat protein
MPLIKRDGNAHPAVGEARLTGPEAREALRDQDPARRRAAAQGWGEGADPAPLAEALVVERDKRVREALVTALIRLGAAAKVAPLLRSADAALRAAGVEALQALPDQTRPLLPGLLADPDPDVRILAAEVVRTQPADRAIELLSRALERESHPNACAAAVDVLAELGTPDAAPVLRAVAARFGSDPFLPFAVSAALARIGGDRT